MSRRSKREGKLRVREEVRARKEAKRLNREYRPGSARSRDEAKRLEDGFKMMQGEDTD